jgi:hypothetical protein
MNDLIVISTWHGREEWARECSESIERDHIVVTTDGFELGVLKWCFDHTSAERVVLLQDTNVIIDNLIFDLIDNTEGSICLNHNERHYGCYTGVYERQGAEALRLPAVHNKAESIEQETAWNEAYAGWALDCSQLTCWGEITNPYRWVEVWHHRRWNVVYSTRFLTKWQSQWGQTPLEDLRGP